eukprot:g896.t1
MATTTTAEVEYLRREKNHLDIVREQTRDICLKALSTEKGKQIAQAESIRLRARRKACQKAMKKLSEPDKVIQTLRNTFEIYDVDCSNTINIEEFKCILEDLCIPVQNAQREFEALDASHEGKITFEFFYNWYRTKSEAYSKSNGLLRMRLKMKKKTSSLNGKLDLIRAKKALINEAIFHEMREARIAYRKKHFEEFRKLPMFKEIADLLEREIDAEKRLAKARDNEKHAREDEKAAKIELEHEVNSEKRADEEQKLERLQKLTLKKESEVERTSDEVERLIKDIQERDDAMVLTTLEIATAAESTDTRNRKSSRNSEPPTKDGERAVHRTPSALQQARETAVESFNTALEAKGIRDGCTSDFASALLNKNDADTTRFDDKVAAFETCEAMIVAKAASTKSVSNVTEDGEAESDVSLKKEMETFFADRLHCPLMFHEFLDGV